MAVVNDGFISVKAEIDECMRFFTNMDVNKNQIQKRIMTAVGTGAKQAVKKNYNHYLNRRSGTLYKSIKSVVTKEAVYITNNADSGKRTARDGRTARYGFMLAAGYTIEPKHKKFLSFVSNGRRYFLKSATVKPVNWVEPSVMKYIMSGDCKRRMDNAFQKQVDFWEKRITGGNVR